MEGILCIAICDDERHIHDIVGKMLETYGRQRGMDYNLIHFFSASELFDFREEIHILLLDIDMPQVDGIEAAARLKEDGKDYSIIMLTGRAERFKDAFKIGARRFVTKPVDEMELYEALDAVRESLVGYETAEVSLDHTPCRIPQRVIDYVQACGDYVLIHAGEQVFESDRSLKGWERELDDRLFVMCHKSYLVNMKQIRKIEKDFLVLDGGVKLPLARRRKKEALQKIVRFDLGKC